MKCNKVCALKTILIQAYNNHEIFQRIDDNLYDYINEKYKVKKYESLESDKIIRITLSEPNNCIVDDIRQSYSDSIIDMLDDKYTKDIFKEFDSEGIMDAPESFENLVNSVIKNIPTILNISTNKESVYELLLIR